MNNITLRIHSVKCIDETGGSIAERVGNDEIDLSGFGVDPAANSIPVSKFRVYSHFDDGDVKNFSPPRNFVTMNLNNGTPFPKSCSVSFLLAEIDGGGFGSLLSSVFEKVKEELTSKKNAAIARKVDSGGSASLTGVELSALWVIVKPIVMAYIINKIASGISDDVFPPNDVSISIPSANFLFPGGLISEQFPVDFRGHNGIYRMMCDWELS